MRENNSDKLVGHVSIDATAIIIMRELAARIKQNSSFQRSAGEEAKWKKQLLRQKNLPNKMFITPTKDRKEDYA